MELGGQRVHLSGMWEPGVLRKAGGGGKAQTSVDLDTFPHTDNRAPLLCIDGRFLKLHPHHPVGHGCFQPPTGVGTVQWETRAIA